MKCDIILAGVGGQGILTLSYAIVNACLDEGYNVLQSEIHGMSQRGGAVYAHLRISDKKIYSDMIPKGRADIILGTEPLEALRHLDHLTPEGKIITSSVPVKNIIYPDEAKVLDELRRHGALLLDSTDLARKAGSIKAQNIVMLGAVSRFLPLKTLKMYIKKLFSKKGKEIVKINLLAFDLGLITKCWEI
ncbi:indolepyruvate oxidoreductase [Candidatus Woesearchaeota archaeon CG11_big_fil_rev_8_21_14_0_20_43_8]|uniref:Indolepyruvate oxidoreductase n=1 Tax=Candidatus Roizmanbacteria bacterium CG22_combo_CG10-13_8_21_14_all_35_9 TaxID=1974861 RepID=A0A2H0BXJ7_9BACT|nr:MAG: indolepyruvate oxidoreductase [Candidatus Woesearchaeota archaeon CG11_big_fil_rev_8_21_14_0_20_43_8]PIP62433.1 MAG: indolepyruvate oxidoreductase [Candidatus Roizmanbacteria bacterium CG22_combo_CG10-13_8_21_14_all_35_9]